MWMEKAKHFFEFIYWSGTDFVHPKIRIWIVFSEQDLHIKNAVSQQWLTSIFGSLSKSVGKREVACFNACISNLINLWTIFLRFCKKKNLKTTTICKRKKHELYQWNVTYWRNSSVHTICPRSRVEPHFR